MEATVPWSHGMILAVEKGIGRGERYVYKRKKHVRLPLTWAMLVEGRQAVVSMEDGGHVMWSGLAVSYFLLGRASELLAYANRQANPEFWLTRKKCISFFHEGVQVAFENSAMATAVEVTVLASKCDQNGQVAPSRERALRRRRRRGGGIQSSAGTAGCVPKAASGSALDG